MRASSQIFRTSHRRGAHSTHAYVSAGLDALGDWVLKAHSAHGSPRVLRHVPRPELTVTWTPAVSRVAAAAGRRISHVGRELRPHQGRGSPRLVRRSTGLKWGLGLHLSKVLCAESRWAVEEDSDHLLRWTSSTPPCRSSERVAA